VDVDLDTDAAQSIFPAHLHRTVDHLNLSKLA
jgi:hypothetical protein